MTVEHIIIHDTRLPGQVHNRDNMRVVETHCETLERIARRVDLACYSSAARQGQMNQTLQREPASVISIFAHGVSVEVGPIDWAMQVGLEYIHKDNARAFGQSIRNCVSERIRVMCCNGAGSADARLACRALAVGAGVQVFAATTRQDYDMVQRFYLPVVSQAYASHPRGGWINFGRWE